jgi:hypothetical protein
MVGPRRPARALGRRRPARALGRRGQQDHAEWLHGAVRGVADRAPRELKTLTSRWWLLLARQDVEVNKTTLNGCTALFLASQNGLLEKSLRAREAHPSRGSLGLSQRRNAEDREAVRPRGSSDIRRGLMSSASWGSCGAATQRRPLGWQADGIQALRPG